MFAFENSDEQIQKFPCGEHFLNEHLKLNLIKKLIIKLNLNQLKGNIHMMHVLSLIHI